LTIRPFPLQTQVEETRFPGCLRREHEVRCATCGRFMSSVLVVIYFDDTRMGGAELSEHLSGAGIQIQAGASGKCLRCKEENAQILFTA
jgi:hypothetical protein